MSKALKIILIVSIFGIITPIIWRYTKPYGINGASDESVYKLAIKMKDISICDKIHLKSFGDVTDKEIQSVCYREYAKIHPEENVCKRLLVNYLPTRNSVADNVTYSSYSLCISAQAQSQSDPELCLQLEKNSQPWCIVQIAYKEKNTEICNLISDNFSKQNCSVTTQNIINYYKK